MCEADAEGAVGDDFGEGGGDWEARASCCSCFCCGCGGGEGDVEVAFYELEVWRELAEEVVDGGGGEVS